MLVEYGFLDSKADDVNQLKNNYKNYAQAVVDAILEYKNVSPSQDGYVVKSGDTLWAISKKFGVPVNDIKNANNLVNNTLSVGQSLKIPNMSEPISDDDYIIYTVKSGDSIYSIASKNNLNVNDLKNYNNLTSNTLQIGQTLKIPVVSSEKVPIGTYEEYIVKNGDTLYSIGKNYEYTPDQLINYNDLSSSILTIGQVLKIPIVDSELQPVDFIEYTIKKGDTLYSIANKYDTNVQELKNYNNLTSNTLSIGQIIKIPVSNNNNSTYEEYIVKSGDSLYSISKRFGYTVQELMNYNNLKSNLLSIGQIIKIPIKK